MDPAEVHRAYVAVQRPADAEVLRVLRDAYKDVNAQLGRLQGARGASADTRRGQLMAVKRSILEAQGEVFDRTGQVIERRRVEAAARAISVAGRYDQVAFEAVGRGPQAEALARGLEATEVRGVEAAVARLTGSSVPLSERVYRAEAWSSGRLNRRINSGLARGLSAEEMARELRDFIRPDTPGGVRYAALRLARTEINNAFHAISIQAAMSKPWISKMEWHTSGSHARPDECDRLRGQLFAPEDVPRKPHPMCLCYITPVVEDDDDAFLDALVGGEYDDYLDDIARRAGLVEPEQVRVTTAPVVHAPVRGVDRTAEVLADFDRLISPGSFFLTGDNRYTTAEGKSYGTPGDGVLRELLALQGFGASESGSSSDVDVRLAQGWTEIWRGVRPYGNTSAEDQIRGMCEDADFMPGSGIYGNGIYFSVERRVGEEYARADPDSPKAHTKNGALVRAALSPDARVINYRDLMKEHGEFLRRSGLHGAVTDTLYDPGRYAAMRGYDVIVVEGEQDGTYVKGETKTGRPKRIQSKATQYVVLNRGVMIVER